MPSLFSSVLDDLVVVEEPALAEAVRETYDRIGQADMITLLSKTKEGAEDADSWKRVLSAVELETKTRMSRAKEQLEELMEAGEINELDKRIVKLVKAGGVDPAFLTVLNQNMEDARQKEQAEGKEEGKEDTLLNVFTHISSRVQEELEKRAEPGLGLVHKLMRTEDAGLRGRILNYYLTPQREILMPDTTSIPLKEPKPARVSPMEFAASVLKLVTTLRSLDINGDLVVETIEQVRMVAAEARGVVAADELYDEDLLDDFTEALAPAFSGPRPGQDTN